MEQFRRHVGRRLGVTLPTSRELHMWSIDDIGAFWSTFCDWAEVRFDAPPRAVRTDAPMPATRWFPGATLSYAAHVLAAAAPERTAIISLDEAGEERRTSFAELRADAARAAAALRAAGVGPGDHVVGYLANVPEAIVLLLGCAAVGAVLATCAPDAGVPAVLRRFAPLQPKLLVASDHAHAGGQRLDTRDLVRALADGLPTLRATVLLDAWRGFLGDGPAAWRPDAVPFEHPIYVLFTSGTTGPPKGLVHTTGGALVTHLKEHRLHCDIRPGDVVYYQTTTSWMMWNWLASALASGATIVLYDGGFVVPVSSLFSQWKLIDRYGITHFGTSARFAHTCMKLGVRPSELGSLETLRCVLSTGSPLSPAAFEWVYERVKPDVHLASISGGTDIVSCFMLGDPTRPVVAGEIQGPGLGIDLAAYDEAGAPVVGAPGELVCRQPIPSMPLGFTDDPDGARYRAAYFERYPGVWHHGDLVEITERGGVVVHGRSDATLKPGGVRIGTAEIYEALAGCEVVVDALAAGKREDDDVAIWLFVVLRDGRQPDPAITREIRAAIKDATTPHHVPRRVLQVDELPRTPSGKLVELAVTRLINGEPVPREQLANPSCLDGIAEVLRAKTRARRT